MMGLKFLGLGSGLPKYVATNDELATIVETSDEWIRTRTGIEERRIIMDESLDDLIETAARQAMEQSGVQASQLDLIVVSSVTTTSSVPSASCVLQYRLRATCPAFDLNAACSGFVYAVHIAEQFLRSGALRYVLIVGAEALSRVTDWSDRRTCILFGDGAGAAVMGPGEDGEGGILHSEIEAFGEDGSALYIGGVDFTDYPLAPKREEPKRLTTMDGRLIFDFAVRAVSRDINICLDKCGWQKDEVDWVVLHQANSRIIQAVAQKMGMPIEKYFINMQHLGNTSSATIPLCLDEMQHKNLLKSGDRVIMVAFGGGLTAASAAMIW